MLLKCNISERNKTMKAYKIVNVANGELTSVCCYVGLSYKIGQKTVAEFGKLFVFKTKKHAINYYNRLTDDKYLIFRCEVDSLSKANYMSSSTKTQYTKMFWNNTLPTYLLASPPTGTYYCNEVTLLKQVYPKN